MLFGALAMAHDELLLSIVQHDADSRAEGRCRHVILTPGDALYVNCQPCQQLYVVASGLLKSVRTATDGSRSVSGFALSGDLLGLDGIVARHYRSDVLALVRSELVAVPLARLALLGRAHPAFNDLVLRAMGRVLAGERDLMHMLRPSSPALRVTRFFDRIGRQRVGAGLADPRIASGVPLRDLASYLAISPDSAERALAAMGRLQQFNAERGAIRLSAADPIDASEQVPNWCQLDAGGAYMVAGRA
jgi:CRP/FNR family transcriptional regulator